MLGLKWARIKLSQLQLPVGALEQGSANPADFLTNLRQHGLPGGFSGAQAEAIHILVEQCQRLVKDYPAATILWVVPQKKRSAVVMALQQAHISYTSAEFGSRIAKHVTLL